MAVPAKVQFARNKVVFSIKYQTTIGLKADVLVNEPFHLLLVASQLDELGRRFPLSLSSETAWVTPCAALWEGISW